MPGEVAALPEPKVREKQLGQLKGGRVLVVDDNRTNRLILNEKLRGLQMRPKATGVPEEALEWIAAGEQFDVCVIDYMMPGMNGCDLARRIKEERPDAAPPMILFSSISSIEPTFRERVAEVGFQAVLTKPAKSGQLINALAEAIAPTGSAAASEDARDADVPAAVEPLSILLVDDNAINQKVAKKILNRLGYAPDIVSSGQEAIDACLSRRFDVVLMDVEMPGMDGITAARLIREQTAAEQAPYLVALTANAMASDRESYLHSGMDDYLSKPIDVGALSKSLRAAAELVVSGSWWKLSNGALRAW